MSLTKLEDTGLTILTIPLILTPLCLLLLVRLGDYKVNLCVFYFYKDAELRINLNIDGAPLASLSHTPTPITLANLSSINLFSIFIFRCSSPPRHPVCPRRVDPSALGFSLSSHRHS
jgi:hypothetical protein